MSLSQFLVERMEEARLNKRKFSDTIGIQPTELNRLLAGKAPSKNVLSKLSKGLNLSADEIMDMFFSGKKNTLKTNGELQWGTCHDLVDKSKEICSGEDVLTTEEIARTLCKQDEDRYALMKKNAGEPKQWEKIFSTYPKSAMMFYFIRERENGEKYIDIAGDWSLAFFRNSGSPTFPLDQQNKNISDDQILLTDLPPMNLLKGKYDVVILNMSLANRYNEQKYTDKMLDTFEESIRQLPNDVDIESFYINVFERDYAFFKNLGFEPIFPDKKIPKESVPVLFQLKNKYCGNNKLFKFNRG